MLNIRRLKDKDFEEVYAIEKESFSEAWSYQSLYEDAFNNPLAHYFAAEEEGRILGYIGAHIILDEGHITTFAVKQSERRRGVGSLLLQSLIQYAANSGVNYMTLEVRESNTAVHKLYAAAGFFKVHVRKRYYEDNGEDAYLMVCDKMPEVKKDSAEKATAFE
ncbi:MAG TPA: ribosomal protein S18-alanine N-acetyltransferase [Clostridiales bacterium]|jgi:ribosomal-protein-alanine N-acetyltransferase|nr:ribosomal protein S18-alanine N-acetyltransferase [Clostridiales bacterium]